VSRRQVMNCYTIFKQTNTHADSLAAVGAADVLRHLDPRIVDLGDRFEVRLRKQLSLADLEAVEPGFSYFVKSRKSAPNLPPERIVRTRAASPVADSPTISENRMYGILGRMNAYGGPNQVISRFTKMKRAQWETRVWECLHGRSDFVSSWPLVQLFNPHAARGYALLKPSGTNRSDKTKDRWAEPFLEWLRFRGYFEGSAGWFASNDLRLFSPIPGDVPYSQLAEIAGAFRDLRMGGTGTKMDCRAVLGLTRLLIERAESYCRPRRRVRGVWVTQYKDMGQAHTVMAMDQLAVPDWFDLRTAEHAQLWLQTLQEHEVVLRRLTDSPSDEFALLKQYRRTLQAQWKESIGEFVEFLIGYGMLLFKRRSQDHWFLPRLSVRGVALILKRDPDLRAALRNPGFLAVAAALRSSTFAAQAARHNGKSNPREVRYGLLNGIRHAGLLGRRELSAAVSSFVSDFNQEATTRNRTGLRAAHIQNAEMEAFATLMERWPSKVSPGSLLCGLASCIRSEGAVGKAQPDLIPDSIRAASA
jgi:hypothetical protein